MDQKQKARTTKAKTTNKPPQAKTDNSFSQARENDSSQLKGSLVDRILFLQRAIGNKAVQRLVQANFRFQPIKGQVLQAENGRPQTPEEQLRDELDDVFVDEDACLGYISQLGPAVASVRTDRWMMGRMAAAFNAREMMEAVQRLAMELKWAVYWLEQAGEADNIGNKGYDTLISATTAQQIAELIGWQDVLNVVKANYAGNPLTMFPPLVANNAMLAHVFGTYGYYVDWILEYAGARQFLQFLVNHDPSQMIGALDKSGKWTPFLDKLPKGMGLMPADKTALFTLFNSTKDINRQVKLFEIRFNVKATKAGGTAWESKGLKRTWEMLNILPAADVEGNPNLDYLYRAGSGDTSGESDMSSYVAYWYDVARLGEIDTGTYTDPGDPMHKMKIFDGTIIHEIGHTVDGPEQKYSKTYCKTEPGGGWEWHTATTAVDAMIAASPWPSTKAWTNAVKGKARQACINAATNHSIVEDEANAIDPKGNLWNMIQGQRVAQAIEPAMVDEDPWMYHGAQKKFGTRYYHEGYEDEWYSYLSDRYDAKLSKYQFRDPSDWFAETYTCYYMTVDPSSPKAEDAGKKVPEPIKTWFRENVAKTAPPPGGAKHP